MKIMSQCYNLNGPKNRQYANYNFIFFVWNLELKYDPDMLEKMNQRTKMYSVTNL